MKRIYRMINKATGELYIGCTSKPLAKRLFRHQINPGGSIKRTIKSHGKDCFTIELMAEAEDKFAHEIEKALIVFYNPPLNVVHSAHLKSKQAEKMNELRQKLTTVKNKNRLQWKDIAINLGIKANTLSGYMRPGRRAGRLIINRIEGFLKETGPFANSR